MILIDKGAGSSASIRRYPVTGKPYTVPGLIDYPPLSSLADPTSPLYAPGAVSACSLAVCGETYRADVLIVGQGPSGALRIGIEVKEVTDLIGSLKSGRLQAGLDDGLQDGQLSHLLRCYDLAILMVYGLHRPEPETGYLQTCNRHGKWSTYTYGTGSNPMKYEYLSRFLTSPSFLLSGIHLIQLPSIQHCCQWIYDLHHEWSKPFDSHKSTHVVDKTQKQNKLNGSNGLVSHEPITPGTDRYRLKKRVAFAIEFPGIGYDAANAMARHFPSTRAMFNARPEEIAEIRFGKDKRRIGKVRAEAIEDVIR